MKLNLSRIWAKNNKVILNSLGTFSFGASIYLTHRTATKLSELKSQKQELDPKDYIKNYAPVVIACVSTLCCFYGASVLSDKQARSLASAYGLLENGYKKYRNEVINRYGEEVDKDIRDAIAIHCSDYHQWNLDVPDNKVIWYDDFSGNSICRYEREIIDAEYHINRNLALGMDMTLNDYYKMFGFPQIPAGEELYFVLGPDYAFLDFYHDLVNRDDGGTPIYTITPMFPPEPEQYWKEIGYM